MRRRPEVKLLLSPPHILPGMQLRAEAVVLAKRETPVDFVSLRLRGSISAVAGGGESEIGHVAQIYSREWRSPAGTLPAGENRYPVTFDLPSDLPPSYSGAQSFIRYFLRVHVSIPWWLDRVESFAVPIACRPSEALPPPRPQLFATSADGPRGTTPFMEVALETTQLAAGEVLSGSVSLQNFRGRRVKGIEVAVVETESIDAYAVQMRPVRRYAIRVHEGAPRDGEPIAFRLRLPVNATPTFGAGILSVASHLEVRAIMALGDDVVILPSLHVVAPAAGGPPPERGWVAPIGRERRALVWNKAAESASLVSDPESERMVGSRSGIGIEIRTEQREADFWLVAALSWPRLGLDLDVGERKWTDLLSRDVIKLGSSDADGRFVVHAREHAQARAVLGPELLAALLAFEQVDVDDVSATLAVRGAPHATAPVDAFVASAMRAADAMAAVIESIPPPALFAPHVAAWRAFAERLRGRLELGRMHVHDAVLGTDSFSVGAEWTSSGALVGTRLRVAIDPPLETAPATPEDPATSPAARETWRELRSRAAAVVVTRDAVLVEVEGKVVDPADALPLIELAVSLRRSLAGIRAAGPFR